MQQDKKLDKMISEILGEGESKKEQILKEKGSFIDSEIEKTKADVTEEAEILIKQRCANINTSSGRTVTNSLIDARRALFKRRHEIMEQTFSEAKKRIEAFTKTEDYNKLLLKSAENIASVLKNDCSKILIREADMPFAADIAKRLGNSITVQTDSGIKLGGIIAFSEKGGIMIDDTLDERLEKQKDWFVKNSGLNII